MSKNVKSRSIAGPNDLNRYLVVKSYSTKMNHHKSGSKYGPAYKKHGPCVERGKGWHCQGEITEIPITLTLNFRSVGAGAYEDQTKYEI